jgi:MFS transporter, Spinster family, sphingosine-1-phosphate transporter
VGKVTETIMATYCTERDKEADFLAMRREDLTEESSQPIATITEPAIAKKSKITRPSKAQALAAFVILLIINILNYTDRSILSAVQTHIQAEFGLSDLELGLLNSSFLFIYGLATLPLGIWADRGVRKNIIAICVGIWSVATALVGIARNFLQIFVMRALLGIGEAGYAPASLSLIGDYFSKEVRGRMLSIWSTGNLFGTALGLALGGLIADTLGWRWAFYIVGIPGLIAAFLIWRAVEPQRGASDATAIEGDEKHATSITHGSLGTGFFNAARKLAKTPTYWVLVGAMICSFFIIGAALVWFSTYLIRTFALSSTKAGVLSAGALAGGSLIGTLLGGWLADMLQRHFPQGRMTVAALAFLLGAPLTWLALSSHQLATFAAAFVVAIICLSMCLGPIQAIIQDITTPDMRSTAIGLALLLGHLLGDASSPTIVGWISSNAHSLGFALLVTGPTCLLLAGLICLIGLKTVAGDMQAVRRQLDVEHT